MNMHMRKMITAGAIRPATTRTAVEIVSVLLGKEMLGSVIAKGRRLGLMVENPAPTAAMALKRCQLIRTSVAIDIEVLYIITIQSMMYDSTKRLGTRPIELRSICISADLTVRRLVMGL